MEEAEKMVEEIQVGTMYSFHVHMFTHVFIEDVRTFCAKSNLQTFIVFMFIVFFIFSIVFMFIAVRLLKIALWTQKT